MPILWETANFMFSWSLQPNLIPRFVAISLEYRLFFYALLLGLLACSNTGSTVNEHVLQSNVIFQQLSHLLNSSRVNNINARACSDTSCRGTYLIMFSYTTTTLLWMLYLSSMPPTWSTKRWINVFKNRPIKSSIIKFVRQIPFDCWINWDSMNWFPSQRDLKFAAHFGYKD